MATEENIQEGQLSPEGEAMKTLLSVAGSNPELLEKDPTVQEFLGTPAVPATPGIQAVPVAPATPAAPAATPAVAPVKTRFSSHRIEDNDFVFKTLDDANEVIAKRFGFEKEAALPKLVETSQKWRNEANSAAGLSKKLGEYEKTMNAMPGDLANAFKTWLSDGDYRAEFSGINYNKPVEAQSPKAILDEFFPGQFTDEDVTAMADNPATLGAFNNAKTLYTQNKKIFDQKTVQNTGNFAQEKELRQKHVSESVNLFKDSFPNIEQADLNEVSDFLHNGDDTKIIGLFFDSNGMVKKDAAKNVALLLYGNEELAAKDKIIVELQAALKSKGGAPTGLSNSANFGSGMSPEMKEKMSQLSGYSKKPTY